MRENRKGHLITCFMASSEMTVYLKTRNDKDGDDVDEDCVLKIMIA